MRRKEFEVNKEHPEDTALFLQQMSFGFLTVQGEQPYPTVVPLNFVYHKGAIYFHGSRAGEKMKTLKKHTKVTFAVADELSIIPSYIEEDYLACPATSFFKSVIIYGQASIVEEHNEKCEALQAFMEKLQPQGGYAPITADDPAYVSQVKATSIVKIEIDYMSSKFKFGQNWKEEKINKVQQYLKEQPSVKAHEAATLMARYCPHAQKALATDDTTTIESNNPNNLQQLNNELD